MAMMLALTVVEPQSSGIGGGGFFVYNDGKTGLVSTIDGREAAPMAATPQRFSARRQGAAVHPGVPRRQVGRRARQHPADGDGHARWGKLPWKELFAPAIRLAEDGYQVTRPMTRRRDGVAAVEGFPGDPPTNI